MWAWGGERLEQLSSLPCSFPAPPGQASVSGDGGSLGATQFPQYPPRPPSQDFVGTKVVQCPWHLMTRMRVHGSFLLMGYYDVLSRGQHEEGLRFMSQGHERR